MGIFPIDSIKFITLMYKNKTIPCIITDASPKLKHFGVISSKRGKPLKYPKVVKNPLNILNIISEN